MINRAILVGNLTADAEAVTTTGRAMTRMRLATNHQWKDDAGNQQEAAEFHGVVCFGRLAEVCAQNCSRGARVYIEGRLRTRDYEGSDGIRRYTTEIVATAVKVLQARKQADEVADGATTVENGA